MDSDLITGESRCVRVTPEGEQCEVSAKDPSETGDVHQQVMADDKHKEKQIAIWDGSYERGLKRLHELMKTDEYQARDNATPIGTYDRYRFYQWVFEQMDEEDQFSRRFPVKIKTIVDKKLDLKAESLEIAVAKYAAERKMTVGEARRLRSMKLKEYHETQTLPIIEEDDFERARPRTLKEIKDHLVRQKTRKTYLRRKAELLAKENTNDTAASTETTNSINTSAAEDSPVDSKPPSTEPKPEKKDAPIMRDWQRENYIKMLQSMVSTIENRHTTQPKKQDTIQKKEEKQQLEPLTKPAATTSASATNTNTTNIQPPTRPLLGQLVSTKSAYGQMLLGKMKIKDE